MRPPSYYTSLANRHSYTPSHTYTQTHSNYGDSGSGSGLSSSSYTSTLSSSALRSSLSSPSSSAYAKRTHLPYVAQSTLVAHAFTGPRSYGGSTSSSYSSSYSTPSSSYYAPSSSSTASTYSSRPSSLKRSAQPSYSSSSSAFRSKNPYLSSGASLPRTSYLSSTSARSTYTPSRPSITHYYQPVKLRERPLLTQISREINRTPSPGLTLRHREASAERKSPAEDEPSKREQSPARERTQGAAGEQSAGASLKPPSPFGTSERQDPEKDWSSDVTRLISRNKFIIKFREFDKQHRPSLVEHNSNILPVPETPEPTTQKEEADAASVEQISDRLSSTRIDTPDRVDDRKQVPKIALEQAVEATPDRRPEADKDAVEVEKAVGEKPPPAAAKEKRENAKPKAVKVVKVKRAKEAEAKAISSTESIDLKPAKTIDRSERAVERVVESERCQVVAVKDKIQPMQVSASTEQARRLAEQEETIRIALKHRRASADKKLKLKTAEVAAPSPSASAPAETPDSASPSTSPATADSPKQKAKRTDVVTKKSKGSTDKLFSLVPVVKTADEPVASDKKAEAEAPRSPPTNQRIGDEKVRREPQNETSAAEQPQTPVGPKDKAQAKEKENERPATANEKVAPEEPTKKEIKKKKLKVKVSLDGTGKQKPKTKAQKGKESPPTPASANEVQERPADASLDKSNSSESVASRARQVNKRIKFREYNLDDFNFLSVLGHGGWGFVILAELKEHDACFAVKCIKKITIVEDDDFDSIMIERKMLTLGNVNPFICKLFCTFETEGYLFFVMEYCAGGDLMFHVQHEGKFTEPRCRFYAAEIISAIRFLHNRHIIYRDLKLDNILLDATGHIRLVDFGMCQCRTYREEMLPSNFCGTPEYISPEIIKGVPYNHSVDWWSFGVLLYEMAVGKMPFRGNDENELLWNVCYEQIHYPMFLTRELTSLLQALLEREPTKRMGMATCKAGDICDQAWFRGVDWSAVESLRVEPPFVPQVTSNRDVRNFDTDFTESACELSPVDDQTLARIDQNLFKQFPYTNPNISIFDQT